MCAINGFNFKSENLIQKMNQTTSHRGPDGTGIFLEEKISLGHNRLSIIDLSESANQPMISADGNLAIVFNGEIYNYQEIKKEISDYLFKTNSDTEVILASYQKWGEKCVKKLNGIFAFAIWNKKKQELFLARDPVGVKPLYYYLKDGKFIFSSEIKAILEHDIKRQLNIEALNHYLRLLYVPGPLTMFEDIFKFPPASYGVLKNGILKIEKYWEAESQNLSKLPKGEMAGHLEKKIGESVKSQLISDRPLGIYLSGGIDSSIVLDCVSKNRDEIDTFSVGFDLEENEEKEKFNKDFNLARETANFYKTNHHEVKLSSADVISYLEKSVWHMDEPISNPTALAMMKIAEFTKKEGVDVILGGDGGDELFGGYERYRISLIADYYQKLVPFFLRKFLENFGVRFIKLNVKNGLDRFKLFMFQNENEINQILSKKINQPDITKKFFENNYFAKKRETFMEIDRKTWLTDFSLMLSDKMSMASAVEARVPLLDKKIVEFSEKIPEKFKVSLLNTKIILKKSFTNRIPKYLLSQPKRGWFSPGAKWLRKPEVSSFVAGVFSPNYYDGTKDLFLWDELQNVLDKHTAKEKYNLNIIWAILVFQIWAKRYKVTL